MRTYVCATVRRTRAPRSGGGRVVGVGCAALLRPAPGGRQSPAATPLARGVGDPNRPFHPARTSGARAHTAGRGDGRTVDIPPRSPQGAALRGGPQRTALRAVRSGRGMAWPPHGVDPGPRQRRRGRPSSREPADRLPELRRHVGHPLRAQCTPALRSLRHGVQGRREHSAALLTGVWSAVRSGAGRAGGESAGRAAAVRAAGGRGRGSSWCAVGRKYGVSDNAVRKWVRTYEREAGVSARPLATARKASVG
jgi:hypothetical protein